MVRVDPINFGQRFGDGAYPLKKYGRPPALRPRRLFPSIGLSTGYQGGSPYYRNPSVFSPGGKKRLNRERWQVLV